MVVRNLFLSLYLFGHCRLSMLSRIGTCCIAKIFWHNILESYFIWSFISNYIVIEFEKRQLSLYFVVFEHQWEFFFTFPMNVLLSRCPFSFCNCCHCMTIYSILIFYQRAKSFKKCFSCLFPWSYKGDAYVTDDIILPSLHLSYPDTSISTIHQI